jgi:TATA-box binding protein (TBP) (component of TFIID and TFIIIB)
MVCTGAKSEKIARRAVRKVVRDLKENNVVVLGQPEVFIQNIVATTNFNGLVDLEFAADLMDNVMYEPEQFPGPIYRMANPRVVMLIFASGKSVITGAKSEKDIGFATPADVEDKMGLKPKWAKVMMKRLFDMGLLERPYRGCYCLTEEGKKVLKEAQV